MAKKHAETLAVLVVLAATMALATAFNPNVKNNNVVYWGQGYSPKDVALRTWCQDNTFSVIQISFLYAIVQPYLDCALCWSGTFSGTSIPNAPTVGQDIIYCQGKGIDIGLSYGGATGQMTYSNQTQAESIAVLVWNMFFGGSSTYRPFGSAKLDGIDFDLETTTIDPNQVYFAKKLRALMNADTSKKYWMSAAPQCPFRDLAMGPDGKGWNGMTLSNTVLGNVPMDFISIQFYNNYCQLSSTDATTGFTPTYKLWHSWAVSQTLNPKIKITVGYLSRTALSTTFIIGQLATVSSLGTFGGFMQWQAAELVTGVSSTIKTYLDSLSGGSTTNSTVSTALSSSTAPSPRSSSSSSGSTLLGPITTNGRCGAAYGTICNPYGAAPCCSNWGWCGSTAAYCTCTGCIDYRISYGGGQCGNGLVDQGEECDGGSCCNADCTLKPDCKPTSSHGLNITLIVSASAGAVAVLAIVATIAVLLTVRRRRRQRAEASARSSVSGSGTASGSASARESVAPPTGTPSLAGVSVTDVAVTGVSVSTPRAAESVRQEHPGGVSL